MRPLYIALAYVLAFIYHALWKWFVPFTLPALLAGILGMELLSDLPPAQAIPAALMLAGIVAAAWWQWWQTEGLRERLKALEQWREEHTEYYYLDENGEEKICDY
jgi:hypothetical protein